MNRGIGVEGLACVLAGCLGIGTGVTSFSENIGAIGVTRVSQFKSPRFAKVEYYVSLMRGHYNCELSCKTDVHVIEPFIPTGGQQKGDPMRSHHYVCCRILR